MIHNSSLGQENSSYLNNRENESVRANISHHLDAVARHDNNNFGFATIEYDNQKSNFDQLA
jgi:hypothetical protein